MDRVFGIRLGFGLMIGLGLDISKIAMTMMNWNRISSNIRISSSIRVDIHKSRRFRIRNRNQD